MAQKSVIRRASLSTFHTITVSKRSGDADNARHPARSSGLVLEALTPSSTNGSTTIAQPRASAYFRHASI